MEAFNLLPVYKVENDCIISMQGDVTVAFKLSLPEIFSLSTAEYEAYHQGWVKAIRLLPVHSVFHKQDWFMQDRYRADFENVERSAASGFLSRSSERFFNEREFLSHECFVFLTKKPAGRKLSSSAYSNILRKSIVPPSSIDRSLVSDFIDVCGQFRQVLEDTGFVRMEGLGNDDLASTANAAGLIERYCFLLGKDEASMIGDIQVKDGLKVGDKHLQLFTFADTVDLPSLCGSRINYDKYSSDRTKFSLGFATPLGQLLDCNHIYNQYVFIGDAQLTLKRLEAKKLRLQSLSGYSRENAISRDAVNDFLNEAIAAQRLPVKAHFNVLTWTGESVESRNRAGGSRGRLEVGSRSSGAAEVKNMVSAAMAKMDAIAKLETAGAPQVWFAGLPGNEADFPMNDTFDTFLEQATCFFNQESSYQSSLSPFGIRFGDRLSGRPVHVDISDEPMRLGWITNRSKFVCSPSGAGKSFLLNHMLRSYYEQGAHCVVVDIGHSYRGLCDLVGGYYFTYTEENPVSFNPFFLGDGEVLDTEKRESIKTLLLALWKKDEEGYRRSEYVAISNALTMYYAFLDSNADVFPCFNSFYEFLMSEYLQVLEDGKVKEKDFDVSNFLYVLNPYYHGGEFDYLLNAKQNLDMLHERFVVFELDNIKDHPILFPVVTLVIMEMILSKMRKLKGVRKVVLIEEAWKAIARQGMAEYVQYLFKTMRKFFGEPIVVTQEIEDVISSPIVKNAIINNSDCKILLDQSKYQNKFDQIQELLGLTEKDKALILSLNKANDPKRKYKECAVILGSGHTKVYRVEVSLEEYYTYTTEEKEKVLVQEYAARFGGMQKGIEALAEEIRSRGG
ncbi:Bacteroides conjugation system ATPase, TraG family [Pedobacter steynii]|uniref:Bacteroides conjugation system ATPase, TraG family n=1 Tax=Pedobacter steynii TaxID=430522 RepID=A0A1G9K4I2_9SPHI|nr:TraG family conjugative transposon ATPase [Pedobacter steynii]NQX38447.1 TraG family conjugative transposon ATPase [Pedobacter steynii]SDL44697.1 Bacteroides conjugation system ATPase, TraG family [Pedobacter steynii]